MAPTIHSSHIGSELVARAAHLMSSQLSPAASTTYNFIYFGVVGTAILFGIIAAQCWAYFHTHSQRDKWPTRLFVSLLIVSELVSVCLVSQTGRYLFIIHFGDISASHRIPTSGVVECVLTVLVGFAAQMFFVTRIYVLNPRNCIGIALITIASTAGLASGLVSAAKTASERDMAVLGKDAMRIPVGIHNGCSLIADLGITICLGMWTLGGKTSQFSSTREYLRNLLVYVVGRGVLVSVTQIATCCVYFVHPSELYWVPLWFSMSRFYVITLLAILNSRDKREDLIPAYSVSTLTSSPAYSQETSSAGSSSSRTVTPEPWQPLRPK